MDPISTSTGSLPIAQNREAEEELISYCISNPDHIHEISEDYTQDRSFMIRLAKAATILPLIEINSDFLKDREFMLEAFSYTTINIKYFISVVQPFRSNRNILFLKSRTFMLDLIKQNPKAMIYLPAHLMNNIGWTIDAVLTNWEVVKYLHEKWRANRVIIYTALIGYLNSKVEKQKLFHPLIYASQHLLDNCNFMLSCIHIDARSIHYAHRLKFQEPFFRLAKKINPKVENHLNIGFLPHFNFS